MADSPDSAGALFLLLASSASNSPPCKSAATDDSGTPPTSLLPTSLLAFRSDPACCTPLGKIGRLQRRMAQISEWGRQIQQDHIAICLLAPDPHENHRSSAIHCRRCGEPFHPLPLCGACSLPRKSFL